MTTQYKLDGQDLDETPHYVTKSYLIDVYPNLVPWMRTTGVWGWGYNGLGQLGDNTTINKSSPVQTIAGGTNWKSVASGAYNTAAIKTDGTLWVCGYNGLGALGDNTTINKSSPVQTIAGGTNWKSAAYGQTHAVAIKTDGTLWTWGYNALGQLGDNTTVNKSSPVQTIAGGTNWKQVVGTYTHTAAIKTDGTLWVWGNNASGQLGDNTTINKSSPVQTITGGTNWKSVAVGYYHTAAIKTDGTLWVCGYNGLGALGDNTTINKSSPVQTIAGGTNWKSVASGADNTAAIKTDGTLWVWGNNASGQLGDNTTINKSSPVQTITGGTNWKSAAGMNGSTAAIKIDGTLWVWGNNASGQLGDNTTIGKSSPVQTIAGGTNWKSVTSNPTGAITIAIRDVDD